jgi:hypothetical protein
MPVLTPTAEQTVQVNDLYLAAYLFGKGAELTELRFNPIGRAALVFEGENILVHRKAFSSEEVSINIPSLRANYHFLRETIKHYQKTHNYPKGTSYAYTRRTNQVR